MNPHDIVFVTALIVAGVMELIMYFVVDEGGEEPSSAPTRAPSHLAGRGAK
jgi:hypothetical protein